MLLLDLLTPLQTFFQIVLASYVKSCVLNLMLLVANFVHYKMMQYTWKMTEPLAHWYSSESTQRELSNEYKHDTV